MKVAIQPFTEVLARSLTAYLRNHPATFCDAQAKELVRLCISAHLTEEKRRLRFLGMIGIAAD
jgi:hypothetical protein